MTTFGKAAGGGRRRATRAKARILATLSTIGSDFRVGLVNLSSTGARLGAPYLPREGDEVIFKADNVQSFGQVVWARDGQCGVAFDGPITSAELERLRGHTDIWGLTTMSPEDLAAPDD